MRGSLLAGEALLSHGADLRIQDGRGYTSCHVAAQYGQTAFIYMCALRWRADIDRCASRELHHDVIALELLGEYQPVCRNSLPLALFLIMPG